MREKSVQARPTLDYRHSTALSIVIQDTNEKSKTKDIFEWGMSNEGLSEKSQEITWL